MTGRWKGIGPVAAFGKDGRVGASGARDGALCRAGALGGPGRMQDQERSRNRPASAGSGHAVRMGARRCAVGERGPERSGPCRRGHGHDERMGGRWHRRTGRTGTEDSDGIARGSGSGCARQPRSRSRSGKTGRHGRAPGVVRCRPIKPREEAVPAVATPIRATTKTSSARWTTRSAPATRRQAGPARTDRASGPGSALQAKRRTDGRIP